MAIPDFQTLMLPLLKMAGDRLEHSTPEAVSILGDQFHLTEAEKNEMLPSGRQQRFLNRVGWSRSYLKMAGLLQYVKRGVFCITDAGIQVLDKNPSRIDIAFLRQFPAFLLAQAGGKQNEDIPLLPQGEITPEEILEEGYQRLRDELAQELLERVKQCTPSFFETLVVDLLVAMGYGGSRKDAGQAVGQSGDGGIDGVIKEDKLGLDTVYIQAKRWQNTVGRPDIQLFSGSLDGVKARKGVFITTSQFAQTAKDYAKHIDKKIILVDGKQLAEFMIDYGIGVTQVASYAIYRTDDDYFTEG